MIRTVPRRWRRLIPGAAAGLLLLAGWSGTASRGTHPAPGPCTASIELLDSVQCWCSPLWGHNAPKIVEGKRGEIWVALFSGDYPEASVQVLKRTGQGPWERGRLFTGAYQPSLLFVDGQGRLNILQNSQTSPIIQFRSADAAGLMDFDTVCVGNGQGDGRGWYVGAGVCNDTVFMSYITLSYDLFLTWKHVLAPQWNPPVRLHAGSVDSVQGNHSWTRPRLQFAGRKGYLVVNETSDGSVKNTYNAVHLVTFDIADPAQYTTECIDRVPQGFGAYSSDFAIAADGWMYCVVGRSARIYDSPSTFEGDPGVYVFSRPNAGGSWTGRRVFNASGDASLVTDAAGGVTVLRTVSTQGHASRGPLEARGTRDHGASWDSLSVASTPLAMSNPSHLQVLTASNSWGGRRSPMGVFEDWRGRISDAKSSRYGIYFLRLSGHTNQEEP